MKMNQNYCQKRSKTRILISYSILIQQQLEVMVEPEKKEQGRVGGKSPTSAPVSGGSTGEIFN